MSNIEFQKFQMNNAIFADPDQNLCLTRWLEFALAAFDTNSSTRLNLMHAPIRGHHVHNEIWTTQKDDILHCKKDYRSEALDIDKHVVGIYKEDRLVGYVPIELSRFISYFLQESETNEVKVAVNGKRRREFGLLVPGKYCARTESKRTVKILGDQLKIIREKYTHFSWQYEEQEMYYKIPVKKYIS